MKSLVKSSVLLEPSKKPPAAVSAFSPDDLAIVQKRQDWRLRVAHICIEYFEHRDKASMVSARKPLEGIEDLAERFSRISDYVKRSLPSILVTGVTVHELEAVRCQVSYFLEEVVRHLRTSIQRRLKTKSPLQTSTQEEIETEVRNALEEQGDSLCVFIEDLVKLAHFELEVSSQRERIRLLLGGDRRLSGLGNNETIMSAPLDQLWKAIDDFVAVYGYLRENLPPLLENASPYPALEEELKGANDQLRILARKRIEPFERRLDRNRTRDRALEDLEKRLEQSLNHAAEILELRVKPLLHLTRSPREGLIRALELNHLRAAVRGLGEEVEQLPPKVESADSKGVLDAGDEKRGDGSDELERHLGDVLEEAQGLLRATLVRGGESEAAPESHELEEGLAELDRRIRPLRTGLNTALLEVRMLRETRMKQLREHFCALMGEVRTFLQTSFAHIAAQDPRSTESSYHFFLREFSDEAQQAILLLHEIRGLEYFINKLQKVAIAGLPLTPENLARILRVLFVEKDEEKKRIPSGEGWRLMSSFVKKLRDELVPRLQRVCALDGIRYEDKNFLSDWAMDLAHNCTLCLTEHEIGYSLLQEMGRLRDDPDALEPRQSYIHIVTAQTCRAMQQSLTEICMTLTASIPYVAIMRGGIEHRASIFFHRQQKLLESGPEPVDEPDGSGLA